MVTVSARRGVSLPCFHISLCLTVLCSVLIWAVRPAIAQTTTADVLGTVSDATGAPLAGATVQLLNEETREVSTRQSNEAGDYIFNLVQPGRYSLSISGQGFKKFAVAPFNLSAGDRAQQNAHLQVGSTAETVEVTGVSPALHTDSSVLTNTITAAATQDLPLNGRNYVTLAQLTPGANEGPQNGLHSGTRPDDRRMTSSVSVNGQTEAITDQMVDGMDNNERIIGTIGIRPSVDAIEEVRVESNVYTAEAGRTAGGLVNVITKSGTDSLHGSVFEFLRNTDLNAYPYAFGASLPKQAWHQNQFGGSLGGPILRDRTFFFGGYEGFRLSQGQNPVKTTVPTLFEEQNPGNFSDLGGPVLAASQIDPVGLAYFMLFPAPNAPGTSNNYITTPENTQNSDTYDARVDHRFSPANMFYARYTYNAVTTTFGGLFPAVQEAGVTVQPGGNIGGYYGPAKDNAQNGAMNFIHIFSPSLLLELKASYTNVNLQALPQNYGNHAATAFGMPNVNIDASTSGLPPITINGYASLGDGTSIPIVYNDNIFQYMGAITWTHGGHNIKVGGALIRRLASSAQSGSGEGEWTFTGASATPVLALTSMVEGAYATVTRNYSLVVPHYQTWEPSGYFQDDWKVNPTLTLNLGLRYDVYTPFTEDQNRISNFDPVAGKIIIAGQDGVSRTVNIPVDYSNLAPRIGFAKTLHESTVLRGGFGMSFAPENIASGASLKNQPFVYSYGPYTPSAAPAGFTRFSAGLPLPVAPNAASPVGSIPAIEQTNFRSTYVEQFNLTVERSFAGNVARVSYVGMLGRHMIEKIPDFNAPALNDYYTNHSINYNALRPYYADVPRVTSMPIIESNGSSSYNALQTSFERRTRNGLTVGANYTYSHNLDDALTTSLNGSGGYGVIPSRIAIIDYGNSDLDMRHRVNFTADYALPWGNSLHGFTGVLAHGWQMNGIAVWGTGTPFSALNATNIAGNNPGSSGSDRPNQIGVAALSHPTVQRWFNINAFAAQPAGTVGTARRNSMYGPGYRHVDLSLFKNFNLYREAQLQFRTEAFNVTNTASFGQPNATIGLATVGTVSALNNNYNPRVIQFALKLSF